MTTKEVTIEIKNPEILVLIFILAIILFFELGVTFNNPIVFGDEAFHARMAQWIGENIEYPTWVPFSQNRYFKQNFGRPPYWNLLIASFLYLFGFNEAFIRFLPPFVTFLTGLVVFLLGKELYNKKVGFIASIITVTIPSFVTYSVLIYTDVLVTFYVAMFFLLFSLSIKTENKIYLILSGVFGAFAFLTKTSGFAAYVFIFLALVYELVKKRKFYEPFKKYFTLFLILIIIPSTFFLRSYFYYKTPICAFPYINKVFDTSGCGENKFEGKYEYVGRTEGVGTEQSAYGMGIINYLTFAYGNIWFVVFATCCGFFIVFSKRKKNDIFILLMLSVFLLIFNYFTSRAEDAARYSLAWAPFIALLAGNWLSEVYEFIKKYQRYIALIIFIFVIVMSYQNMKDKLDIMAKVKQFSPTFFEACNWIKENTPEDAGLFTLWSSRAAYNCQRKCPGCLADLGLSKNVSYTLSVAKQCEITHLFIQKFSIDPQNKHFSEKYDLDFVNFLEAHPENFKKVYENGPSLQQCLQGGGCDGNIVYEIVY